MTFDIAAALLAGLVAALVMTVLMQAATAMGMTRMPAMMLIQGTMITGDRRTANLIGAVTHVIVMGTVVFGLIYAGLFVAFDDASTLTGALIGLVHGLIAGVMMVMMGAMHPRMDPPPASAQAEPVTQTAGGVRLLAPGLFAKNYGAMTPVGLVIGHIVYGLVVALVYNAVV